jgi:predicted DNA-binding transcriptional regulator AlpA
MSKETYLSAEELATLWGVSNNTLRKWRWEGKGPRFTKLGARVVYRQSDIDAFAESNVFSSTTELGGSKNA